MQDIRLAIALLAFLSIAVVWLTLKIARRLSPRLLDLAAVGVMALIALYLNSVWGKLWIVKYIPLPSVIVLSNWFPLLLAALGGVMWVRLDPNSDDSTIDEDEPRANESSQPDARNVEASALAAWANVRRITAAIVLTLGGIYSVMHFIPRSPPECGNEWFDPRPPAVWPVCHQTTPDTCSAAACATILFTLGIESTEQEMARLCLTRSGTTWLGMYHGLSTKLLYTDFHTEFFEGDIDRLTEVTADHPALLCCLLDPDIAEVIPEFEIYDGWKPGTAHTVVYFGMHNGFHVIGDPSVGYEAWSDVYLNTLWTGEGLRIVRHNPPSASEN